MDRLGVYFGGFLVGYVVIDEANRFGFAYDDGWRTRRGSFAISQALPLDGPAGTASAHAFFANLLPEGRVRQLVARRLGISESNDFALLDKLGGECAGALVIARETPEPAKQHSYRPLDDAEIARLASHGRAFAETSGTAGVRLSLAGAQDKLAVKVEANKLLLPEDASPSTHILKFANRDYKNLPENELLVTKLAARCGLPAVEAELTTIGNRRHLLVRRYDRIVGSDGEVRRLHQEDLCQALGVPPGRKYEEEGGPGFAQCFAMVDDASVEPALDTRALIRWLAFNLLTGNADGHAKNLSLLRTENGALRLAPFYDLLSTAIYPRISTHLAMKIGDKSDPGQVGTRQWRALARSIGVGSYVESAIRELAEELPSRAKETAADLEEQYGRLPPTDLIIAMIRKRARRALQTLKP